MDRVKADVCVIRKEKVDVRGMELELELVKMKKLISQVEGPSFEFRHKAAAGPELRLVAGARAIVINFIFDFSSQLQLQLQLHLDSSSSSSQQRHPHYALAPMRRWTNPRALLSYARRGPSRLLQPAPQRFAIRFQRAFTNAPFHLNEQTYTSLPRKLPLSSREYAVFEKVERPQPSADAWVALLDGALPPHLRDWSSAALPPNLSAVDVAEILLAAQHPSSPEDRSFDLLLHMGFQQDRWSAVVWLVKKLVDKFPAQHAQNSPLAAVNALWKNVPSLSESTTSSMSLELPSATTAKKDLSMSSSLDELTDHPHRVAIRESLQHDALGQIWLSLGNMTKACAGGDIRPEVLEILAYLHHREIMPMSIYQFQTHFDKSAIQQPPLLSMLSSRILTSLSDAAWRAHEKLVTEEAKAKGGEFAALRPEVLGSVYRVHVGGLRPEVWMELILWSCIHGGWWSHGADILRSIVNDNSWKPLSWREYEKGVSSQDDSQSGDWNDWEFVFKTRSASTRDAPSGPEEHVDRTISAEVINAYIDVLASNVSETPDRWGVAIEDVVQRVHEMRTFLRRPEGPNLSLSSGSWDALAIRLIETASVDAASNSTLLQRIISLSLQFGEALTSPSTQDLPGYVLDGNLALQGLLHRALYGQINAGSVEGALDVLKNIQKRADTDKLRSVQDFVTTSPFFAHSMSPESMFTSNVPGIEYPAFSIQIPPPILGSFLDLMSDARQWAVGRWLTNDEGMNDAVIDEQLYTDPHVQPAVLRFAAESNNSKLMRHLRSLSLSDQSYQAMFDSQVNFRRWIPAERVLKFLPEGAEWNVRNLANLTRVMMSDVSGAASGNKDSRQNLETGKWLFGRMLHHRYDTKPWSRAKSSSVRTLLFILAAVREEWSQFSLSLLKRDFRYENFTLDPRSFNLMLEGIVAAYGSTEGRRLVATLWPKRARALASPHVSENGASAETRSARITLPIHHRKQGLTLYGALEPSVQTLLIIFRKALEEMPTEEATDIKSAAKKDSFDSEVSPQKVALWSLKRMAELPQLNEGVIASLDKSLAEKGLHDMRECLPRIFTSPPDDSDIGFESS